MGKLYDEILKDMGKLYDEILKDHLAKELLGRIESCGKNKGHINKHFGKQICTYCYLPLQVVAGRTGERDELITAAGLYTLEKLRDDFTI